MHVVLGTISCIKQSQCHVPESITAEDLNDYFHSNFQQSQPDFSPSHQDLPIVYVKLSVSEVQVELSKLQRKSCAPDDVPFWVYKNFSFVLAHAVTFLFNWILAEGMVPLCLKNAVITPIPKTRKPSSVSEFRPISILPLLSKILKKFVVRYWISPFICSKIKNSQYAYLSGPGSGTTNALTLLYNRIVHFLDRPGAIRVLSIDFAKAFDKVLHNSIIDACYRFHLPLQAIKWISSFLSDRKQCVRVRKSFSQWSSISSGVPQGSVVGPLLFCMVVDDFCTIFENSLCVKYADDFTILHFIRNSEEDRCQLELNNASDWAERRGLPINFSKCTVMDIVTKKTLKLDPIVTSHGYNVENVSCIPLFVLGVTFSSDMKWDIHISNAVSKASRKLYILYNLVKHIMHVFALCSSTLSLCSVTVQFPCRKNPCI